MKKLILFVCICLSVHIHAQNPLQWGTDIFGENVNSGGNTVSKSVFDAQGNIYVAGSLMLEEEGYNRTPVVVKLNPNGDTLWRYEQDRPNVPFPNTASYFSDIAIDQEGNIFALGIVPDTNMAIYAKPILVKIDSNGNLLWSRKMFENIASDNVAAGVLTIDNDGSVYFTGRRSITFQQYIGFVWKYDGNGTLIWEHSYAISSYRTTYYNITLNSSQEKLYVSGDVVAFNGSQKLNLVEIIDSNNGTVIKTLRNATEPYSETETAHVDANGNIYVSLYNEDGAAVIRKYDDTLGLIYTYSYFPTGSYDNSFTNIMSSGDGGIYAAGYSYATSNANTGRALYVRLSSEGTVQETFVFPSEVEEYIYDGIQVGNQILFTGATVNANNQYAIKVWRVDISNGYLGNLVYSKPDFVASEGWWIREYDGNAYVTGPFVSSLSRGFSVLKLNPTSIITHVSLADRATDFEVYPNPFHEQLNVHIPLIEPIHVTVSNMMGQIVYQETCIGSGNTVEMNLSTLESGIYFLNIRSNSMKSIYSKKIVKLD